MGNPAVMDQSGVESMAKPAGVAQGDFGIVAPATAPSSSLTNGWYWALWENSSAVERFLPDGGTPGTLATNWTNPETTTAHVLASQILALRLNVEFTCAGIFDSVGLIPGDYCYGNVNIGSDCGKNWFTGMTVYTFLAIADSAVGGLDILGSYGATLSNLNYTATCMNQLYSDCDPFAPDYAWAPTGGKTSADEGSNLPKEFSVGQSYPNPFNPVCHIDYTLPTDCRVNLTIYNILGQKVRVLVDEHQSAGYESVEWDGKDGQGRELTTGIYFYRIMAGDFVQSKKMVLIK
jgi:hypothetical protein